MMTPRLLPVLTLLSPMLCKAASPAAYQIRPPSEMWSSCPVCGLGFPQPIGGSFILMQGESGREGTLYRLSEFSIEMGHGSIFTGSGSYRMGPGDPPEMDLDLVETGSGTGTRFTGRGDASGVSRWPVIRIRVQNPPTEFWQVSLLLSATPRTEYFRCQLGPGAQLAVKYESEAIPRGVHPLGGTFMAGRIDDDPEFSLYRIDSVEFRTSGGVVDRMFTGEGLLSLEHGTLRQTADMIFMGSNLGWLNLYLTLSSREAQPVLPFPDIDAEVTDQPGRFSLRIVGGPATSVQFRRGDTNGDGVIDLSDAIGILTWLFLAGAAPLCQEAADVGMDSRHDPADAIALLQYLFQDGAPPPFPGTRWCGLPQELSFGCESYLGCPHPWIIW